MMSTTSCGGKDRLGSPKPASYRTATVPVPSVPAAKVPCEGNPGRLCVSDEDNGSFIAALIGALDTANGKLEWLGDYFKNLP